MGARNAKREERERRLLEATLAAIDELGLAAVRISDIAERAGMTTGHLSYYFPSKAELLQQAISLSEEQLLIQAVEKIQEYPKARDRLELLVDLSLANGRADPAWLLWFQVWADSAAQPELATLHHRLDGNWRLLLRDVIEYGIAQGEFSTPEPDEATVAIAALMDGLSVQLSLNSPGYSDAGIRRMAISFARQLLGAYEMTP